MQQNYVAPMFKTRAFHCPHCGVYAHQEWYEVARGTRPNQTTDFVGNIVLSYCHSCNNFAIWVFGSKIYPMSSTSPLPAENMPEDVIQDFIEARDIVSASPRSAAALLRLALQKLMPHLGEKGHNLNDDIAGLVRKDLPVKIQQALDAVRVIGNNSVHPGEIDIRDDPQTAYSLFDLLNMIIEVMITQPARVEDIYNRIPDSAREAIAKRDSEN